jgi:sodium/potassium-transporting ATPase subunit alpha
LESANLAFFGSLVVSGSAVGVVTAIGDKTVLGEVSALTHAGESTETSLHREIRRFVWIVSGVALLTGAVTFIAWGAWLYRTYPTYMPVSGIILNAISLVVAYVPEGLTVAVTLALTMVARRMFAQVNNRGGRMEVVSVTPCG